MALDLILPFVMQLQLYLFTILIVSSTFLEAQKFPEDFLFGTVSSSYQIEGGWNADGKGQSIWDVFTHNSSDRITNHSNGDIAANSYHKLEEDVLLLKKLGVNFYTFSLSWTRILPKGFPQQLSIEGLQYYDNLINLLIKNKITPMVALFHWDTPQPIEDLGGFTNVLIADWFEDYAKVVFENYGNRVKLWLTFNDPKEMCLRGYGSDKAAPGRNSSGVADYMCGHNVLKAHARVYHLYNTIYRPIYHGKISIGLGSNWYEAATTSPEDVQAATRALEFSLGWFAEPIYHPLGLYPKTMFKEIGTRSEAEGFPMSRLPLFHKEEVQYIRGTYDFFALNHYTTELVSNVHEEHFGKPSYFKDRRIKLMSSDMNNTSSNSLKFQLKNIHSSKDIRCKIERNIQCTACHRREWCITVAPLGFQKLLNHIKNKYQNPQIFVTGNGFADRGDIEDHTRVQYLEKYLGTLLNAIHVDAVNVAGYAVRSFLDGFEWENGFTLKFGLHHVNFTHPNRTRTPKASAKYYSDIIAKRKLIHNGKNVSGRMTSVAALFALLFLLTLAF